MITGIGLFFSGFFIGFVLSVVVDRAYSGTAEVRLYSPLLSFFIGGAFSLPYLLLVIGGGEAQSSELNDSLRSLIGTRLFEGCSIFLSGFYRPFAGIVVVYTLIIFRYIRLVRRFRKVYAK